MIMTWFIVTAFAILFIQILIFWKWVLSCIQYTRYFSHESVFAGEKIEMIEQVSNKKILPVPWLRLESNIHVNLRFQQQFNLDISNKQFHRSLFSLRPFQKITRRHQVTCVNRGDYTLDTVSITAGDPLGFGTSHKKMSVSNAGILVYPKLTPINEIPFPTHSWMGELVVRRWIVEDPFMISGVREYTRGDPMNNVNWKSTARTGSLQVNKKDFTADPRLMIYVNFDTREDIWVPIDNPELVEKEISYAAAIAQYAISEGVPTGFGCNSYIEGQGERHDQRVRVESKNSRSHLMHILETMARLEMGRNMLFNHLLKEEVDRQMTNADILLITSFVSENMQNSINRLRDKGNAVEVLRVEECDNLAVGDEANAG